MRIQIVSLLSNESLKYQNELLDNMENIFGEKRVRAHKVPPHFTLKYGFNCDENQLNILFETLNEFIHETKPSEYTIGGFGTFNDNGKMVIYTKILPSNEMLGNFKNLYQRLKKLNWLSWENYENENVVFHSTLASDVKTDVNKILQYLETKEALFTGTFNNVALYKFVKEVNYIKEYEIYKHWGIN